MEHKTDEHTFEKALDIVKKGPPAEKHIPEIDIPGAEFGMPGARFRLLPKDDIRALFFGQMTDCCQHVGGAGAACAEHSYASPDGGLYVVEDRKGRIIAGAWAWRGQEGELCLDSLECLRGRMDHVQWQNILSKMLRIMRDDPKSDVTALTVGTGGATPEKISTAFLRAATPAVPRDMNGYRDSHSQVVIWSRMKGAAR
jgi:hypothetical protein